MSSPLISDRVRQFLSDHIGTVPELETLLLLARDPQRSWSPEEVSERLYVPKHQAGTILDTLERRHLARRSDEPTPLPRFQYDVACDSTGEILAELSSAYTRHLLEITALIHSRPSTTVHERARASNCPKTR